MGRPFKEFAYETNGKGCLMVVSHRRDKDGYVRVNREGKLIGLHRYLYEQAHGKLPDNIIVRHKCDIPNCVNLEHLEHGTHLDNARDKVERGRLVNSDRSGSKNPFSILNEESVREIKSSNESNGEMAKKYGVNKSTISAIRNGHIWKHI